MKQIKLWKMLGLYLVTLGIYGIVWMALRREELVKKHGASVPHWLWIVLPISLTLILMIGAAIIMAFISTFNADAALLFMAVTAITVSLAVLGISSWWMWRFSKAVTPLINGRMTPGWALAYWILAGPVTIFALQFYVNRANVQPGVTPKKVTGKPSRRFVAVSIVVLALAAAGNVASFSHYPSDYQKAKQDMTESNRLLEQHDQKLTEVEQLEKETTECFDTVEKTYPEVTVDNEQAYNKAFDVCDEKSKTYEAAVKEYNQLIK